MVLPRPNILEDLHILFDVIQFHDFWFFLYDPALLGGLRLILTTFLRATFLGHLGEVDGGRCIGMGWGRECNTRELRHE